MQDSSTVRDGLLHFLEDRLGSLQGLDEHTDLIDSGLIDSLMLTDLVLQIQAEYGVALQPCDVTPENFRSVHALSQMVFQRRSATRRKAA